MILMLVGLEKQWHILSSGFGLVFCAAFEWQLGWFCHTDLATLVKMTLSIQLLRPERRYAKSQRTLQTS